MLKHWRSFRYLLLWLSFIPAVIGYQQQEIWTYNLQSHLKQFDANLKKVITIRDSELVTEGLKDIYSQLLSPHQFLEAAIGSDSGNVSDACASQINQLAKNAVILAAGLASLYSIDNCSDKRISSLLGVSKLSTAQCFTGFDGLLVLDSWGKPESGLLQGNFKWPGDFDECMNISTASPEVDTRYCTLSINLLGIADVQIGACAPRSCKSDDVKVLVDSVLRSNTTGVVCKPLPSERPWYGGTTAALFFVLLMIGVCCLATLYEIVLLLFPLLCPSKKYAVEDTDDGKHSNSATTKASLLSRVILSFSFYTNACKLLHTTQPPGTITCLNGIRFFSMSWVILGHCVSMFSAAQMKNQLWTLELLKRWTFQPVLNATISVDTFFILSGFLVAYLLLKDFNKRKIRIKGFFKAIPMIYLQRYFRLTPAYGFMLLIYTCLLYYVWDGPNWIYNQDAPTTVDANCPKYWYLNLLYINTLFHADQQCAGWGWYLSNDFQFFLIAPFVVFIYYLNEALGLLTGILTIAGSLIAAGVVSNEQRNPMTNAPGPHYDFEPLSKPTHLPEYVVPWCRYQTYGIGIVAGLIFYKLRTKNVQIPKLLNLFLWVFFGGVCVAGLYGPYDAETGGHVVTLGESATYSSLGRFAWGVSVGYFILSCALGQGGWIDEFLSWKGFIPLSRLTYCSYLIHLPILYFLQCSARNGSFYTDSNLISDFLVLIILTMGLAFPFSLVFEIPFVNLDKIFLAPLSIKRHRKVESEYCAIEEESDKPS